MTDSAPVLHRSVSNLRLVGIAEGISFLLLLGVGMPLKYIAGLPLAVRIMGSATRKLYGNRSSGKGERP